MSEQDELFTIAESLSPFEAWKRRHGVTVEEVPGDENAQHPDECYTEYVARTTRPHAQSEGMYGRGETESAACWELAQRHHWKTWDQEQLEGRA